MDSFRISSVYPPYIFILRHKFKRFAVDNWLVEMEI